MLLTKKSILKLILDKKLNIEPYLQKENVKDSSIMLHLGTSLREIKDKNIDTKNLENIKYQGIKLTEAGYNLEPNEFILVKTHEKVTMPNGYIGWIETRGTMANIGLQIHFCDAHIDPGSDLYITLQLKNNSNSIIKIYPELYIAKMYIIKMI